MQARKLGQIPKLEPDHVLAIRAIFRGTATEVQQRIAVREILRQFCGLTTLEPARMNEREAGFMAGQRWVGMAMGAVAGINLYTLQDVDPEYGWDRIEDSTQDE
jgi:hypothetical protein